MDPKIPATIDEKGEKGESSHAPSSTQIPGTTTGDHNTGAQPPNQQPDHPQGPRTAQHAIVPTFFGEIAGTDGQEYMTLRKRITVAYQVHTWQYWFVAILSNSLLFLQILVAASLTVLGAFNDKRARTATIFLGATNTVIAGLLTYFKSRNQPNRARQFRNDLAAIVDQLDDAEANFRDPNWQGDELTALQDIRTAYKQARTDAQVNYPDLWVRGTTPYNPNYIPRTDTDPTTGISGPPSHPSRAQTWSPQSPSRRPLSDQTPGGPISESTIRGV